jgi:hypothetical protein
MKAFRSSPFLSPAWVLHAFMRSCWEFAAGFFSSAADAMENAPNAKATAIVTATNLFIALLLPP